GIGGPLQVRSGAPQLDPAVDLLHRLAPDLGDRGRGAAAGRRRFRGTARGCGDAYAKDRRRLRRHAGLRLPAPRRAPRQPGPGAAVRLGAGGDAIPAALSALLWHGRAMEAVATDVTELQPGPLSGRLFLIPSSMQPGEIARILREGYDAQRLTEGLRDLVTAL